MDPLSKKQLDETEIEKILFSLPRFERNAKANVLFIEKLEKSGTKFWFSWKSFSFAGSFIALLLFAGITSAAFQPSVTVGHSLYPLKKSFEKLELAFAAKPLEKIETHLKFSDRRLEEAENIIKKANDAGPDEINLNATLSAMRNELMLASGIVENAIFAPDEADVALSKIETAADTHMQKLRIIGQKSHENFTALINRSFEEEDNNLANIVEAREKLNMAIFENPKNTKVQFAKTSINNGNPQIEAEKALNEALEMFTELPEVQKKTFEKKIETAQQALEQGKLGRAKGLSRALNTQFSSIEKKESEGKDKENNNKKP